MFLEFVVYLLINHNLLRATINLCPARWCERWCWWLFRVDRRGHWSSRRFSRFTMWIMHTYRHTS